MFRYNNEFIAEMIKNLTQNITELGLKGIIMVGSFMANANVTKNDTKRLILEFLTVGIDQITQGKNYK